MSNGQQMDGQRRELGTIRPWGENDEQVQERQTNFNQYKSPNCLQLSALFKQKQVVDVLRKNYAVVCGTKGKEVPTDFCMTSHIERVLDEAQFAKRRARTMSIEDFLALMLTFNKADIHFC
ncbi:hypothetical protein niasHT_029067 [Heterodera trifolii]|uniref:Uncharacterized protein n=1 Tax=Heterodera trifolii TaxID=157864 RepID=A0ABD2KRZ0_9BILA